jgi:UDP-N-acetylglucosamine 2-epimerase (non-hydrolysing)
MKTLLTVLGTRPEIIKLSPILPLLGARWRHVLVHTGQHYDHALDGVFFDELRLRAPDFRLSVGSGSHNDQMARMLAALEPILSAIQPDAVLVQGDTNSTLAGALAASKRGIPVIHLEAGCRSFNRRMPEEINRVLVDHCADLLLAADESACRYLLAEGVSASRTHLVGSTAIDACLRSVRFANSSSVLQRLQLASRSYLLCTIHRAENTTPDVLPGLVATLNQLAQDRPLVVPLHPRTVAAMRAQGLCFAPEVRVCTPLGYLDMLQLLRHAQAVLTDSGGLQEEAGALNVPLLVLRQETEWSYLVEGGKALLIGNRPESILTHLSALDEAALMRMRARTSGGPSGAAQRSVTIITEWLAAQEDRHARTDSQPARAAVVGA